jgi:hypothetical protein
VRDFVPVSLVSASPVALVVGILVTKGTPDAIVNRHTAEITKVLHFPT